MLFKTVFVALCVIAGTLALESPVFLWNVPTDAKPSLATVTQNEFSALLTPFLKTHTIVAFLEDDLSSRDLTCQSADSKQSCFAHLSSVAPKAYYASVESPVDALRQIANVKEYNSIDAEGKFSLPVELSAGKVILVNFDKSNNQRGAILEQHDAAIKAVSDKLTGNVVFLYLSSSNGNNQQVKRMRRSNAAPLGGYIFREGAQFLIYFSQVNYTNNAGTKSIEVINTMTVTGDNTTLSVSMAAASGKTLDYLVIYEKGYYNIRNVTFDNVQFRNKDLAAPVTFSYHCGNITLNAMSSLTAPNNAKLTFGNLQFQAPFGSSSQANFTFGNNWDCVPFFTPGILSGLFVTIFLLVITFVGICWMVDINTMDRFEDPKGKTITVNQAAE